MLAEKPVLGKLYAAAGVSRCAFAVGFPVLLTGPLPRAGERLPVRLLPFVSR